MGAPFIQTPRDMSRKNLKTEHISFYRGSVRGTWKESSELRVHAIECSGIGVFFIARHKWNLRHLVRERGARPFCLLGRNLHLVHSYNLEGLWPYFWPQLLRVISDWGRLGWTQKLLGKFTEDQSWPLISL
jgi:hypothetical protein